MATSANLLARISGDPSPFIRAVSEVNDALDRARRQAERSSAGFAAFGSSLERVGIGLTAAVTAPLAALTVGVVRSAADIQALTKGLESVEGSAAAAGQSITRLKEVAKLPGLGFREAVQGYTNLRAAGLGADLAERSLKSFGNALATVGKGKTELDGVILALGQIQTKGQVSAEEIGQLAERVPQIRRIMQQAFGTADTEVLQKAGLSAQQFVERVVSELEKLPPVAGVVKNDFENLGDALDAAGAALGDGLLPYVSAAVREITPLIDHVREAGEQFKRMPQETQQAVIKLGLFVAAAPLAITAAGSIASSIGSIQLAAKGLGITAPGAAAAVATIALAFKSIEKAGEIVDLLRETGFQIERMTEVAANAKKDVEFLREQVGLLSDKFPNLSVALRTATDALSKLGDQVAMPGFALLIEGIKSINSALGLATGRTREMDDALRGLNTRNIDRGQQNVKLAYSNKYLAGADLDLVNSQQRVAKSTQVVAAALKEHNKIIVDHVAFDANGKLSKTSLAYVETLERQKSAVGKVKDVIYEYVVAGTLLGKQLGLVRAETSSLNFEAEVFSLRLKAMAADIQSVSGESRFTDRLNEWASGYEQGSVTAEQYIDALRRLSFELDTISKMPALKIEPIKGDPFRKGSVLEATDILGSVGAASSQKAQQEIRDIEEKLARVKELNQQGKATGSDVIAVQQKLKEAYDRAGNAGVQNSQKANKALSQVSTVITDLSRGIADAAWEGGKFGGAMKKVAIDVGKSITRYLIEGSLKDLAGSLLGLEKTSKSVFGGIAASIGGLFGSGSKNGSPIFSAVPNVIAPGLENGGLGKLPGWSGGGAGAGNAVGAAASGVMGAIGLAASVGSLISGVIGNFQNARQETTLNAIEESTRYTKIWTGEQSQSILWSTQKTAERLNYVNGSLDLIGRLLNGGGATVKIIGGAAGGGGTVINNNLAGATFVTPGALDDFLDLLMRRAKALGIA